MFGWFIFKSFLVNHFLLCKNSSSSCLISSQSKKISKFLAEVSLTEQDFVKDPNVKISKLLADNNASILSFTRYEVGEGIEVEKVDFASEVMSQIEG